MTSRRGLLAGLGTIGLAGLAGCSALPFSDDEPDDTEDVTLRPDAVGSITWPDPPVPVAVPASLSAAHDERGHELLAAVPDDPSIPNRAIAEELRSERERVAERLEDDVEEPWPTDGLSEWRSRRADAAILRGAYRAATDDDDGSVVSDRRRAVRDDLGSFVADHEYRAASPLEAVLAHAPIEELVTDCRRRARPNPTYPADPIAQPFRAGDAVGRVEHARATLDDARGLQEAYRSERPEASTQWAVLIEASDELRWSVNRTRSTVRDVLDADEPPFDDDLDGMAGRSLFRAASGRVELATSELEKSHRGGDYATAVIEAGRALAAIEALRASIDGIRTGAYQDDVTAESVTRTADRAREAAGAIGQGEGRHLAALIARPVFSTFEYAPGLIEEGYTDAVRLQGELALEELYARAVPAATKFVIDRLR